MDTQTLFPAHLVDVPIHFKIGFTEIVATDTWDLDHKLELVRMAMIDEGDAEYSMDEHWEPVVAFHRHLFYLKMTDDPTYHDKLEDMKDAEISHMISAHVLQDMAEHREDRDYHIHYSATEVLDFYGLTEDLRWLQYIEQYRQMDEELRASSSDEDPLY